MTKTLVEGGKRYPLNMRTTEATRARLEKESKASGRSLAQEVEYCVEQYYGLKADLDMFRKPIIQMMALALQQTELNTGKDWFSDEISAQKFRNTALSIIDLMYPFKILSNALAAEAGETDLVMTADQLALAVADKFEGKELEDLLDKALAASDRLRNLVNRLKKQPTA